MRSTLSGAASISLRNSMTRSGTCELTQTLASPEPVFSSSLIDYVHPFCSGVTVIDPFQLLLPASAFPQSSVSEFGVRNKLAARLALVLARLPATTLSNHSSSPSYQG